jgi:hypothetical protein
MSKDDELQPGEELDDTEEFSPWKRVQDICRRLKRHEDRQETHMDAYRTAQRDLLDMIQRDISHTQSKKAEAERAHALQRENVERLRLAQLDQHTQEQQNAEDLERGLPRARAQQQLPPENQQQPQQRYADKLKVRMRHLLVQLREWYRNYQEEERVRELIEQEVQRRQWEADKQAFKDGWTSCVNKTKDGLTWCCDTAKISGPFCWVCMKVGFQWGYEKTKTCSQWCFKRMEKSSQWCWNTLRVCGQWCCDLTEAFCECCYEIIEACCQLCWKALKISCKWCWKRLKVWGPWCWEALKVCTKECCRLGWKFLRWIFTGGCAEDCWDLWFMGDCLEIASGVIVPSTMW